MMQPIVHMAQPGLIVSPDAYMIILETIAGWQYSSSTLLQAEVGTMAVDELPDILPNT
ncbi:hypothetical protein GRI44_05270 [Altererythrobacter confluentis]|uniref:Uncharacterized protein n=1 Tax=Allopontixanthobacter confluentis TaxID=1849021 RepID=A0A6L7GGU0_9SPHN|nr:hypothetical protein [Allopontixanthobacter confluentis]MXP14158.1 hypothetical protein [Allopontixanthobacter confluentis]